MSDHMQIRTSTWREAADVFRATSTGVGSDVSAMVTETTNAAACGAAEGMATVDGAIAIMLEVFGEVMNNEVISPLKEGLTSEADALNATADQFDAMEEDNTTAAESVRGRIS